MTPAPTAFDRHVAEERLVDLVLDELPSPEENRHLDACADCRSLLDSLHRTVGVARDSSEVAIVPPPAGVWAQIEAEIAVDGAAESESDPSGRSAGSARSNGSAGSADAEVTPLRPAPDGRSRRRRGPAVAWLAAACAAGVLVGVGGSVVADRLRAPETVPPRTIATAQLATLDTEQQRGTATVHESEGQVSLEVTAPEVDASGGYAEVWLINRDGERMVSVGVLEDASGSASFPISRTLLDEGYVVVDISREEFDDQPEHSGDSFVRGPLSEQS